MDTTEMKEVLVTAKPAGNAPVKRFPAICMRMGGEQVAPSGGGGGVGSGVGRRRSASESAPQARPRSRRPRAVRPPSLRPPPAHVYADERQKGGSHCPAVWHYSSSQLVVAQVAVREGEGMGWVPARSAGLVRETAGAEEQPARRFEHLQPPARSQPPTQLPHTPDHPCAPPPPPPPHTHRSTS